MKDLMNSFLEHRLSRREFCQALAAMGISVSGVASIVRAAEGAVTGVVGAGRPFTGTGGALMVEQMKAAGVRYLFTNPGSFEVGFFDAFLDQPGVNLILGLHEGIVISMADGYHKVSGLPGFVNLHVIAGTAQSAGQLYNSSRDGSALVVTAGLLDHEIDDDEILLGPRPGFNQKDITRQFTKISWESRDATGLPAMLRRAFKVATTAPGGPVYLAIPNHVLEEKNVTADIYDRSTFMMPDDIPPREDDIFALAELLLNAKNPVLFLGDEVHKANAQAEAFELAELLRIPVSEFLLPAFRCFPRHHSLFVGPYFSRANQHRDLVLNIGVTDLGGGAIPQPPRLAAGAKEVYIGLNTYAIGSDRPFDLAIVANVRLALRALIEAIKSLATKDKISRTASHRSKPVRRTPPINKARLGMSPLHPDELAWVMEQELDKDAILVSESFSRSNRFFGTGFREDEKMWVSNSGAGLGWGIGAAVGAKLANPNRQVVCNIGDGSVMYSAAGFWTQARYEVPVLTVVSNNRNYQTVRHSYARYNGKMKRVNRYMGTYLGDPDIDFVKLAQSQAVGGIKVNSATELPNAIKRGIAATRAGQPFLIEVLVQRIGEGADSTWYQAHSIADIRTRKV